MLNDHPAARLVDMDVTQALEETAVFMKLFAAFGDGTRSSKAGKSKVVDQRRGEELALRFLHTCLARSYCKGRAVHRDPRHLQGRKLSLWKRPFGIAAADEWALDFVLVPVDGIRALLSGLASGAISVLAGGARDSFAPEDKKLATHYLVFMTAADRQMSEVGLTNAAGLRPRQLVARVVSELCNNAGRTLSILTTINGRDFAYREILPAIQGEANALAFHGSSVAAGLTVLFPSLTVDVYVGMVRKAHAVLLSTAALARNAELIAFPVRHSGKKDQNETVSLREDLPVCFAEDFIGHSERSADNFMIATGITENTVLRGIRFEDNGDVVTHSLCLRARHRSSKFVTHHHHLTFEPQGVNDERLRAVLKHFSNRGAFGTLTPARRTNGTAALAREAPKPTET